MPIDPRALRTYLAVCRERSISGAARKLNISQPAVSVTITQLEETLGGALFERSRAGIILSPAGNLLMRRAESLEALLATAEDEVALARQGIAGPFRIGGTPGALASLVPDLVVALDRRGIKFSMHVTEAADADLVEMLRKSELDAALVTMGIQALPEDLYDHPLISDSFSLIVGRANDHLPDKISLADTSDLRWVMPAAAGAFRRQIHALFLATHTPLPNEAVNCDSLLSTLAIVRRSNYVTVLPHGIAAVELGTGSLRAIEISGAPLARSIGIRTLKNNQTATVQALLSSLQITEQET